VFWVISVYFNIRNILLKSDTFLLGHLYMITRHVCQASHVGWGSCISFYSEEMDSLMLLLGFSLTKTAFFFIYIYNRHDLVIR